MTLLKYVLTPSTLITFGLLLSIVFGLVPRFRRVAGALLLFTGLIYFFFGCGPVSSWMMRELEYRYSQPEPQVIEDKSIQYIVVLAGYAEYLSTQPVTSMVNNASSYRILEAIRLYQVVPDTRQIVITGSDGVPELMKQVMVAMGIPEEIITLDSEATNTWASAGSIKSILGEQSLFLVTSAGHMPRAMHAFEQYKLNAVPAPTQYLSKKNIFASAYLPTPEHLRVSDLAVSEYLALLRDAWLPQQLSTPITDP